MTFDRKNGVKLAGVVLSGTLVLGGVVPVAAQLPENVQEAARHQTEEKEEVIVFLNTSGLSDHEEKGPFDEQAVQSLEEAFALFGITDEEEPQKTEPQKTEEEKEQSLILVLCGKTELSEEENVLLAEREISIMTEDSYQEMLKAREAAEKEEEKSLPEIPQLILPGTEEKVNTEETAPPPIWIAPQITITNPVGSPAETAEENPADIPLWTEPGTETPAETPSEEAPSEFTGVLLPGFSIPSGEQSGTEVKEEPTEEETVPEETAPVEEVPEETPFVPEQEETTEEVEEPVYTLFSFFSLDDGADETAEVIPEDELTAMALESSETAEIETAESETLEESHPVLFALPGIDLVGNGTSGVGGGSKPAPTPAPSRPATNPTPSGSSASGSSSAGSSVSNTPAVSVPQTVKPSNPGIIQTGDASNRTLWGLSAGISGAMAAFFAAQWRKLRRE